MASTLTPLEREQLRQFRDLLDQLQWPPYKAKCRELTLLAVQLETNRKDDIVTFVMKHIKDSSKDTAKIGGWKALDMIARKGGEAYRQLFQTELESQSWSRHLPMNDEMKKTLREWSDDDIFPAKLIDKLRLHALKHSSALACQGVNGSCACMVWIREHHGDHSAAPAVQVRKLSTSKKTSLDDADGASDWKEFQTPEGNKYYFNSKTNETTWDRPAELAAKDMHKWTVVSKSTSTDTAKKSELPADKSASAWVRETTDDGRVYFYNKLTKERTWDEPAELKGKKGKSKGLWRECMSKTGIPYYFNRVTKESVWEKPADFGVEIEEDASEKEKCKTWEECKTKNNAKYWYNHQTEVSVWDKPTGEGVQIIQSCTSPDGIPYWYNQTTGESVWEKPAALEKKVDESQKVPQIGRDLGIWQECVSIDGVKYWYNKVTQESTWEPPPELGPLVSLSAAPPASAPKLLPPPIPPNQRLGSLTSMVQRALQQVSDQQRGPFARRPDEMEYPEPKRYRREGQMLMIPSRDILYTQATIKSLFTDGRKMMDTWRELSEGRITVSHIPPIRVVQKDNKIYSLDNRRLWVFKKLDVEIPVIEVPLVSVGNEFWSKMNSFTGGRRVVIRDSDSVFHDQMRDETHNAHDDDMEYAVEAINALAARIKTVICHGRDFRVEALSGVEKKKTTNGDELTVRCVIFHSQEDGKPEESKRVELKAFRTETKQFLLLSVKTLEDAQTPKESPQKGAPPLPPGAPPPSTEVPIEPEEELYGGL